MLEQRAKEGYSDDYKEAAVAWLEGDEGAMKGLAGDSGGDSGDGGVQEHLEGWGEQTKLDVEAEVMFMKYDKDSSNAIDHKELRDMLQEEGLLDGQSSLSGSPH